MSIVANWSYPTAIRFGAGRISEIGEACAAAGIKKPLLITDRGLAKMDITTRALDLLEAAGLGRALFADVDPNPNEKMPPQALPPLRKADMTELWLLEEARDLIWESWSRFWRVKRALCGISKISEIGGHAQMPMQLHQLWPYQPRLEQGQKWAAPR